MKLSYISKLIKLLNIFSRITTMYALTFPGKNFSELCSPCLSSAPIHMHTREFRGLFNFVSSTIPLSIYFSWCVHMCVRTGMYICESRSHRVQKRTSDHMEQELQAVDARTWIWFLFQKQTVLLTTELPLQPVTPWFTLPHLLV